MRGFNMLFIKTQEHTHTHTENSHQKSFIESVLNGLYLSTDHNHFLIENVSKFPGFFEVSHHS